MSESRRPRRLRDGLGPWLLRLYLTDVRTRKVSGVVLADLTGEEDNEALRRLDKLEAALNVVGKINPTVYAGMSRLIDYAFVDDIPGSLGKFRREPRAVVLDRVAASERSEIELAGCLVHELTHARLAACGFRSTEDVRSRIERACYKRQARFLERAGAEPELVTRYRTYVADPPYRTNEEVLAGHVSYADQVWERRRYPRMVARLFSWLIRLRVRRLRRAHRPNVS